MRRSLLPASVMGLAIGSLLLVGNAGCGAPPSEVCTTVRGCGDKTLSACSAEDKGCRYKSNDGHSWSCIGRQVDPIEVGSEPELVCDDALCKIAAQEAADWCFSQTSATTPTAWGDVLVSEIMYDPTVVADELGEWFEIYGVGGPYDLFGCEIRNRNGSHTIAAHLLVTTDGFRTAAIFSSGGGFVPDYTYSGITLANNDADEVSIWCGSTLIDRLSYTASQSATSGYALSVNASDLNRNSNHYRNRTDGADYSCPAETVYNKGGTGSGILRDYGTPGAANPACR